MTELELWCMPISEGAVRDFVISLGGCKTADVAYEFSCSMATARKYLQDLHDRGVLKGEGNTKARRWSYVPPPDDAPRVRPRFDKPTSRRYAGPVAQTGVPLGPSGKPGVDKKRARRGKRIVHKTVKGYRI